MNYQYLEQTQVRHLGEMPWDSTHWNITVPEYADEYDEYDPPILKLLTITGIEVHGRWRGEVGEFFIGWMPSTLHVPSRAN